MIRMEQQGAEVQWGEPLEKLLCEEAEKCSGYAWLHNKAESLYSRRNDFLQIPSIVLSTLTGFLSASSIQGMPQMALGAISILVGVFGTINSYYSFGKRAEGHRLGATQYAQMHRTIHIEMALPRPQRIPPKVMLKMIKEELKRLSEVLPRIPDQIIQLYKKEIIPKSSGITHPEITNGIHKVSVQESIVSVVPDNTPKPPVIRVLSGTPRHL